MVVTRIYAGADPQEEPSYTIDSSFLSTRPRRHTSVDSSKRPNRPYRARSASNILDSTDDFNRRLYDPKLAPHLQRRTQKDGVGALVEFLKHQPPPPSNFMSIPDDVNDDERGKWLKWAKLAKRAKSAHKGPLQIRLPDTAVSGKTIGGHRHIAITIPFEAFPMGERPRSQYPIYSANDFKGKGLPSKVRTVVNEKGVVTVLKTVNEDREGSISSRYSSNEDAQPPSFSRAPSRTGRASFRAPPSSGSASGQRDRSRGRELISSRPSTQSTATASAFPTRGSSMANRSLHQHISIDGLLSRPGTAGMTPTGSRSGKQADAESDTATWGQWPLKEKRLVTLKPEPEYVDEDSTEKDGVSKESGATILKDNPLGPRKDESRPSTPASVRRERVRDKKKRDMEALRNAKQSRSASTALTNVSSLSPIRVILNVAPESLTVEAPRPRMRLDLTTNLDSDPSDEDAIAIKRVSQPTPPLSPRGSPMLKQAALDRTSLSRRREWKATREQERKTKEARSAVRARAKELAATYSEDLRDNGPAIDKEILRLYEAYREHRFRDMERRLRRLERNGDVWLQAIVPILENLNRTITANRDGGVPMPFISEPRQAESRRSQKHRSAPVIRVSSSHSSLRDEDVRKQEFLDEIKAESRCSSAGSESSTGVDKLEPLMRELAGAAKLRQMETSGLLKAY